MPSPSNTETTGVPVPDSATAAAASAPTLRQRLSAGLADPVLRILITATFVMTLGRGVFLTLTVLYFTLVVGLSVTEVALVLTIASAVGAGASLVGGHLADRFSAKRLAIVFDIVCGLALIGYTAADRFWAVLLVACVFSAANMAANSVRSAIIARAFLGSSRVNARAVLRTVTNLGIAVGSSAAGLALLVNTADAYRWIMIVAGAVTLFSALPLFRLPARVNAPPHPAVAPGARTVAGRPGRSPFRDPRYLVLTVLSGVFGLHFGLAEIGLPLWILHDTTAPVAMVSVLLIVNTIIVIVFQIPLSRGTHDIRHAGRVTAIAGVLMAGACFVYAASGGVPVAFAISLLIVATLAHTFAEVLSSAGSWGLSFELADPHRAGAYQGVFGLGWSVSAMAAPLVVTGAVTTGVWGWTGLAALFLAAAGGVWWVARRASAGAEPSPAHVSGV